MLVVAGTSDISLAVFDLHSREANPQIFGAPFPYIGDWIVYHVDIIAFWTLKRTFVL
jgi:hypothetical protein